MSLPLIFNQQENKPIIWHQNQAINAYQLIRMAQELAQHLPKRQKVLNLCTHRFHFLVTFCAILIRQQTNILPPNRLPQALNTLFPKADDTYYITDDKTFILDQACFFLEPIEINLNPVEKIAIPQIKAEHLACILYTSGSTGTPQPQAKTWRMLVYHAQAMAIHLQQAGQENKVNLVATVPPQHMFGLETTILLPLQQGYCIHSGQPFFPDDIKKALETCPEPKALISTPTHLQHCLESDLVLSKLDFVLSATAPLSKKTACQAEQQWHCPLLEIYGCSEVGAIAHRQCTIDPYWHLSKDIQIETQVEPCILKSMALEIEITLPDRVRLLPSGQLELLGRGENLVNIGGKRSSIEELNQHLLQIEGVIDGCYFMPEDNPEKTTRLIAFVVSKNRTKKQITTALKGKIDPLFLPRQIIFIKKIPRNAIGKINRQELLHILLSI